MNRAGNSHSRPRWKILTTRKPAAAIEKRKHDSAAKKENTIAPLLIVHSDSKPPTRVASNLLRVDPFELIESK
jgi:hypothetical protein